MVLQPAAVLLISRRVYWYVLIQLWLLAPHYINAAWTIPAMPQIFLFMFISLSSSFIFQAHSSPFSGIIYIYIYFLVSLPVNGCAVSDRRKLGVDKHSVFLLSRALWKMFFTEVTSYRTASAFCETCQKYGMRMCDFLFRYLHSEDKSVEIPACGNHTYSRDMAQTQQAVKTLKWLNRSTSTNYSSHYGWFSNLFLISEKVWCLCKQLS